MSIDQMREKAIVCLNCPLVSINNLGLGDVVSVRCDELNLLMVHQPFVEVLHSLLKEKKNKTEKIELGN